MVNTIKEVISDATDRMEDILVNKRERGNRITEPQSNKATELQGLVYVHLRRMAMVMRYKIIEVAYILSHLPRVSGHHRRIVCYNCWVKIEQMERKKRKRRKGRKRR